MAARSCPEAGVFADDHAMAMVADD